MVSRSAALALAVLAAALCLAACRTVARDAAGRPVRRGSASAGDPASPAPPASPAADEAAPPPADEPPLLDVEAGVYAGDARFRALAHGFAERVRSAADAVETATGLSFRDRAPPRLLLAPSRDELTAYVLRSEVAEGRRRAVVHLSAEPLVSGVLDVDRVLRRALAACALESGRRDAPVPRWFLEAAGTLAAGDLAERVERTSRATAAGAPFPTVEPADPAAAEATGDAALLVLAERSTPVDVRRLCALVADGDDPATLIPRVLRDREGTWVGLARQALRVATAAAPAPRAKDLAEARTRLDTLGPAGLEDALLRALEALRAADGAVPAWFEAEARALLLEAAVKAGDGARARDLLASSPPEPTTLRLLSDPGAYVLAAGRAQSLSGGDPDLAWEYLSRFETDFPRHALRAEGLDDLLRALSGPVRRGSAARLSRVVAERGAARLDLKTAAAWVAALLDDRRPGAAARFLASLRERGDVPELEPARAATADATRAPDEASLAANRARAEAWLAARARDAAGPALERAADDVADGGAPAAAALVGRLPAAGDPVRTDGVRLLVRAAGLAPAVGLLVPRWERSAPTLGADLDALAGEADYGDLRRTVEALYPAVRDDARAAAEWERASGGLDPAWLSAHPTTLRRLRSAAYVERAAALDEVVAGAPGGAPPALLARAAKDPAALLRRKAVLAAGRAGVLPVAREALRDPSWVVRQAACAALAAARATGAVGHLVHLVTAPDPSPEVRAAAAVAILDLGARDSSAIRPLVALVRGGDPAFAEGLAARLPEVPRDVLVPLLLEALAAEASRPDVEVDRAALFRLFSVLRRASKSDPGYSPSLPLDQVRALVASLPASGGRDGAK